VKRREGVVRPRRARVGVGDCQPNSIMIDILYRLPVKAPVADAYRAISNGRNSQLRPAPAHARRGFRLIIVGKIMPTDPFALSPCRLDSLT
jgi:hypothetical protein